jgi:uncharacterized protein YegL
MPKLVTENRQIGGSRFTYQAARIGDLGATEYTLVTIAIDVTGSLWGFETELREMLLTTIESCKKSPRSDNLLVRVLIFSSVVGVRELHGFKPLSEIDPATDYPAFQPDGLTPLFDTVYSAVGAMVDYGADLMDNDFLANGIVFVITDGGDNTSTATPTMIKQLFSQVRGSEKLESILAILIGVNAAQYLTYLENFQREAQLDQFIDAGAVTPGTLAKLAAFVSQSVSSTSQALGTGGPSKSIAATI